MSFEHQKSINKTEEEEEEEEEQQQQHQQQQQQHQRHLSNSSSISTIYQQPITQQQYYYQQQPAYYIPAQPNYTPYNNNNSLSPFEPIQHYIHPLPLPPPPPPPPHYHPQPVLPPPTPLPLSPHHQQQQHHQHHHHQHHQQHQQHGQQPQSHYGSSPLRRPPKSTPPLGSPKSHWKHKQQQQHHHHPGSPRNGLLFSPRSPYSSTSSPSTQGPHSPSSLPIHHQPLVRGSLAQAKLRGHSSPFKPDHPISFATLSINGSPQQQHHHPKHSPAHPLDHPALPKPPIHSQHALWVGNIPNDASHEELWKFFAPSQPPNATPCSSSNAGVESIHLIARSNCAFVNYASQAHLSHAIAACNGKPLRPLDPYCKPLLCRIRKPEDNIKSGVGAQRIGGMHRSWVKRNEYSSPPANHHHHHHHHHHGHHTKHRHTFPVTSDPTNNNNNPAKANLTTHSNSLNQPSNLRTSSTLTATSNQSQSTTSSFLTNHFPRRYFILKAYTDEDLRISVERSIWVSQTHNEPVLDQAYRTSSEGVYLIFSANQSGEFFGYARMAGPIGGSGRRVSLPSSPAAERGVGGGGAAGRTRSASIGAADRPPADLFGLADAPPSASPRALSPVDVDRPLRWPGSPVRRSLPILGAPRLPDLASSSDPAFPSLLDHPSFQPSSRHDAASHHSDASSDSSSSSSASSSSGLGKLMTGRPFKVDWIRVQRLAFFRTKNLRNPFNGNREVKVSRDGTEVEPSVGQAILNEIENEFSRQNPASS
ncbi:hypothetical protein PCASD_14332 [Puccinia coronata f. sp. avenae]|uniref:YTH domain-containing protein n=1 Tax=Puccinia coronata f. sp. avenae TaxID=200324 RepID=A0A2N5U3T1_9BASI|nr:hypothetical protein PCASD_14332 [Puccinia coronata f. sp. avenae]